MKVAIQGELGSFSHEAAGRMLPRASVVPCARSAEVFDRVENGAAQAAVIPIENSLAGSVAEHFDLLLSRDVFIHAEFSLRIRHNLIAAPGVSSKQIRRVFSHPVALDQCRNFLSAHPDVQAVPFYDTAGSLRHVVAEQLHDAAAIAPKQAAAQYGGHILKAGIEDDRQNYHTFSADQQVSQDRERLEQNVARLRAEERARRALQSVQRFCAARHQSEQD